MTTMNDTCQENDTPQRQKNDNEMTPKGQNNYLRISNLCLPKNLISLASTKRPQPSQHHGPQVLGARKSTAPGALAQELLGVMRSHDPMIQFHAQSIPLRLPIKGIRSQKTHIWYGFWALIPDWQSKWTLWDAHQRCVRSNAMNSQCLNASH